ncbi:MAG TPA: TolC family protein, partial [Candidatus Angelobacter sp.]|nr:TolC family protein [Candidatus Angelobacter sp.]
MNSTSSVFVLSAILLISGSQAICQTIPAAPSPEPSAAATNWSHPQSSQGSAQPGNPSPSPDQNGTAANPGSAGSSSSQNVPLKLSLHDAEQMAIKNHPRITIAALSALASREAARQVKAAFYPTISVNATGVTTFRDGNRITAGALNNPSVFD